MNDALRSPHVRTATAACGVCLLAVSTAGLFLKARALAEARASAAWPSVEGVIIRAELPGDAREGPLRPKVAYVYRVDGREFVGDRVRVSARPAESADAAERFAGEFAAGRRVRVYYDPADPSRSVLVPGTNQRQYATVLVLFVAAGAGGALLVVWRRRPSVEDSSLTDASGRP